MEQLAIDRNFFKVLFAGLIGTVVEWFDFSIYVYLAPIISLLFFPHENPYVSLMLGYLVFAIGYLARPIGGFLFGHYGDKSGRRKTLAMSIFVMSLATIAMGLLPTYQKAGIAAPILLIVLRMVQGIAAAGETVGSFTFAFETAPPRHRGLIASSVWMMLALGILLASFVVAILTSRLTHDQLFAWGWRLPFFFAIVSLIVSLFITKETKESVYFSAMIQRGEWRRVPFFELMKNFKADFFKVIILCIPPAVNYYVFFVFLPTFSTHYFKNSFSSTLLVNTLTMTFLFVLTPLFAFISDRVGRKPMLISALAAVILLSVTLFKLVSTGSLTGLFIAQTIYAVIHSLYCGAVIATCLESVPTRVRYTTLALGYNFSFAIFGGTAPLIATYLMHLNKNLVAPAFYMVILSVLTLIVVLNIRETYRKVIL